MLFSNKATVVSESIMSNHAHNCNRLTTPFTCIVKCTDKQFYAISGYSKPK